MSTRTVKISSFGPGVNNRLEPTRLTTTLPDRSRATYLYSGENVVITGDGVLKRRRGTTKRVSSVSAHSLWGDGAEGYAVVDGDLVRLTPNGASLASAVVRNAMAPRPVSFVRMPDGQVYWSNELEIGRIIAGDTRPLLPPRPASVPIATVVAGGLPEGRYQFAFTAVNQDGESPSTTPFALDLAANSGVSFAGLASDMAVYMTGPNGSIFNQVETPGDILNLANTGTRCATLLMAEMPAGHTLRYYGGRLLSTAGNYLFYSEPYHFGLFNPGRNYIPFPSAVTVVEPCDDGVFVCADQTYWFPGDLMEATPSVVLPFGALRGSSGFDARTKQAYWQSPEGLVIGQPGGKTAAVQAEALAFGAAASGASLYLERDGMTHVITARQEADAAIAAARSYLNTEVTRKETVV